MQDDEKQGPGQTFVWIGRKRAEERLREEPDAPVTLATREEDLFEETPPDSWELGDRVGSLLLTYFVTPSGQMANVQATFDVSELPGYEPGDALVAVGSLEYADGALIRGKLSITGGTGRFRGVRGEADVDHRNPHKYRIST